jgi:ATP phosphoribosyltransferase regulatory subunit
MTQEAKLRALFEAAGYTFIELPIVYPASVFVELAGEDLRRQLYLTSADGGEELALRPDFTIPVTEHHLATGAAKRKAGYAYIGPVFRVRPGESGEFMQAGVESFGRSDRVAADADMLKLAFATAALFGAKKPAVRIGDSALFAALLDALDLSPPWRERLARAFGDTARLKKFIASANRRTVAPRSELEDATLDKVEAAVAEKFAATGLGEAGGRTAEEIAARFIAKEALAHGIPKRAARALTAFLKISGPPAKALKALRALAKDEKLALDDALGTFAARIEAFAGHGIRTDALTFAADFGRRLDYYTGFVFEFPSPANGPMIGGGRYDRMTALIPRSSRGTGSGVAVPAVGFAVWLDRIGKDGRQ